MHKKLTALALLTAAACLGTSAQAKDLTGWFVNGGVGSAHYNASYEGYDLGKDSDTGYQVNAGWRSRFIGFEGGYADLGSVDISDGAGDSLGASGKGWTLGLNGHFNPTDKWYISARAGFFFWNVDLRAKLADGTAASDSENGMNGYAGIGTGIDFNRNWSAGVNVDDYKINKDHFNVGTKVYTVNVEYRFRVFRQPTETRNGRLATPVFFDESRRKSASSPATQALTAQ